MKPLTLMLVACAFLAGIAVGLTAPMARAGKGLADIIIDAGPMTARAVRITATGELPRDSFLPAEFRWSTHSATNSLSFCGPKNQIEHTNLPTIQHL